MTPVYTSANNIKKVKWKEVLFMEADADLFCTSRKKESVLFICSSYIARRIGRGAFKASWVICIEKKSTLDLNITIYFAAL